jgi:cytochrome c oxidase assembly factor CtaG
MQLATELDHLAIVPIAPAVASILSGAIYLRGWAWLHHSRPGEFPGWRAASFLTGVFVLLLSLSNPVDALADHLLVAHMTQHILLMSVIPPLIALGSPTFPFLRGSPKWLIRTTIRPVLSSHTLHKPFEWVARPLPAVLAMNIAFIAWHVPALYELALRSESWHSLEHLCFLATSLLFWWKIIDPLPSRHPWSPWTKIACLVFADVANTGVSAYLSFCAYVIYPSYEHATAIWGLNALADQNAAGAEMWVINSLAFLIPAMIIPLRELAPSFARVRPAKANRFATTMF